MMVSFKHLPDRLLDIRDYQITTSVPPYLAYLGLFLNGWHLTM